MSNSIDVKITLDPVTCCACGVVFGMERHLKKQRVEDHASFYCPNGHSQHFTGETEADQLRKQLKQRENSLKWARERAAGEERRADHAERRLAATKGVVTKMKKRVGAGVCPCCNRHFSALERHMASQHPEFATGKEA